jgi:hypothetical protein
MISLIDSHELEHVLRPTVFLPSGGRAARSASAKPDMGSLQTDRQPFVGSDAEVARVAELADGIFQLQR